MQGVENIAWEKFIFALFWVQKINTCVIRRWLITERVMCWFSRPPPPSKEGGIKFLITSHIKIYVLID